MYKLINNTWDNFLNTDKLLEEYWFIDLIKFINLVYKQSKTKVCPERKNIFKMFEIMKPNEIKVFMMFQDPYPQLKHDKCVCNGIGLAATYLTKSLINFNKAIDKSRKEEDIDITVQNLTLQGVFSINKYLTVSNKPLSHAPYNIQINDNPIRWDLFMTHVLKRLNEEFKNIIYIFFGLEAQSLQYTINQKQNLLIKTSHPSPRGYLHGMMDSNFSTKTNNYLKKHDKTQILW